ncbi:MAG: hypothetical protein J6Y82_09620 [Bacteroidales bacterium]|nr:hypothetical protein [Bacteroidales bacterium]
MPFYGKNLPEIGKYLLFTVNSPILTLSKKLFSVFLLLFKDIDKFIDMLQLKKLPFFISLVSIYLIITYIQQEYVSIPQISNLDVPDEIKERFLKSFAQYRWVGFAIVPVFILIRVAYAALCLFLKELFASDMEKTNYSSCFNVALKADIIMLVAAVLTSVISVCMGDTSVDCQRFYSLVCLADAETSERWLLVPLAAVNVFEIVYWFFMAKLFATENHCSYRYALGYVVSGYGVGYMFYIVLVIFLVLYLA